MSMSYKKAITIWAVAAAGLVLALACSTDSPTAPTQTPAPPPGTDVSAVWNIRVSTDQNQTSAGATVPVNVTVRVQNAATGQPPPNGTTVVLSTTLGEFQAVGSGLTSIALSTSNGRASALFFPGTIEGSAVLTVQLESSAGQTSVQIREALVAAFDFINTTNNRSFEFRNLSTGDPRRFFWSFGDGGTSREENPSHVYDRPGDYLVELRITRGELSAETSQFLPVRDPIFIADLEPNEGFVGTQVTVSGEGFRPLLRAFFQDILSDVLRVASDGRELVAVVPPVEFDTEPCELDDGMGGTITGEIFIPTYIPFRIELEDNTSQSVANAFLAIPGNPICIATS